MNTNPIDLFQVVREAREKSAKSEAAWQRATRKLFDRPSGAEWLALAMARINFMGSVFSDEMSPVPAAYRDGMRAMLSEILNALPLNGDTPDEPDEN